MPLMRDEECGVAGLVKTSMYRFHDLPQTGVRLRHVVEEGRACCNEHHCQHCTVVDRQ